ncbi:MAG: hypothetical protein IKN63_02585 [Bacilli bacterium]|nr:hypothetical protein [Bacilli bacterium]
MNEEDKEENKKEINDQENEFDELKNKVEEIQKIKNQENDFDELKEEVKKDNVKKK